MEIGQNIMGNGKFSSGKCLIYTRVSRLDQVEGDSLDFQEGTCKDYAIRNRLEIIGIYSDKGVTGRRGDRKGFTEMRNIAGKGDTIISYSISRLSRSVRDFMDFIVDCEEREIMVKAIKENIDTNSAYSVFMTTLMAALSQLEANLTQERISDLVNRKRKRGDTYSRPPFGYRAVKVDKDKPRRFIPDIEEQMIINRMIEIRKGQEGKVSYRAIQKTLESEGYKNEKGNVICYTTVRNVLDREYSLRVKRHKVEIIPRQILEEYNEYSMPFIVPMEERHEYLACEEGKISYNGNYVDDTIEVRSANFLTKKSGDKKVLEEERALTQKDTENLKKNSNLEVDFSRLAQRAMKFRLSIVMKSENTSRKELEKKEHEDFKKHCSNIKNIYKNLLKELESDVKCENKENNLLMKKIELKIKLRKAEMAKIDEKYNFEDDIEIMKMQMELLELEG